MKNTCPQFKINYSTYFIILTFLLTGLIKNIILIYGIIIFHELGHIFIIKCLKYPIIKVEIYPLGGITTISKKINSNIYHDLLISIFGFVFQFLLFLIFSFLFLKSFISLHTYNLFLTYNKTIFLFNLLPIIPLDGYHFLKGLLELIFPYKNAFYVSLILSFIFLLFFITFNHLFSLNNYLILVFLIYKLATTLKDFKYTHLKFLLERHLNAISYHKIKYHPRINIDYLKKDTYHYFKTPAKIYSETEILRKKFDK